MSNDLPSRLSANGPLVSASGRVPPANGQTPTFLVSNPELVFQRPDPVAGHAELRLLLVFQPHQDAAVHPSVEFLHQADVDDRRAMNTDEAPRIELLLELGERELDDVLASVRAGERQFVLREKMGD